jgi:hypothetical protein
MGSAAVLLDPPESIDTGDVFQYSPSHDSSRKPFSFFSATDEKENASLMSGKGAYSDWNLMNRI